MGKYRPIKTKDWVAFLEAHGCKYKRTASSHDHYKCPNCFRTITHREKDPEIPALHLKTNLTTIGYSFEYLLEWIENNR